MAKPLTNENALYAKIKDEGMTVPVFVWDAIYNSLGDHVTFINFEASYYIDQSLPIPVKEAKKMLDHVMLSMDTVHKIIYPQRIAPGDTKLQKIKDEAVLLPGLIKEFLTHYLGNDLHIIGLCLQFYLDATDPQDVLINDAIKIQEATRSICKFLERLRQATTPGATP